MWKKALAISSAFAVIVLTGACKKTIEFGVVADVQYHPGKPLGNRYYSTSLDKLKDALAQFNKEKVQFVINLGDTIDHDFRSFDAVMPLFKMSKAPVYNVVGNHDFSVKAGEERGVLPALGLKDSYYAFSKGDWLFIVLDGFELRFPFPADETLRRESEALYTWLRAEGKEHAQRWNGGIGLEQLSFLERQLGQAQKSKKNAIVICHFPVLPESAGNLWNDAEVVALLEKHPPVKAFLCGHNHAGDYAFRNGIHYLTFQGMVETPDQNAFAVVTLEKNVIRVQGFGRETSRTLEISPGRAAVRNTAGFEDVNLRGELGTRFAAATANLLTRSDRYPLESYRASAAGTPGALWWDWPGDQIGRMLAVMHVAQGYGWTTAAALRQAVAEIILPLQSGHGNFGPELPLDQEDARLISGNAFALRGLMDAYEDGGEERLLEAARKLARYFEATFETWKEKDEGGPVHEFYGHCLDGLVRLYELGGDEWALNLAERIGDRAGRTNHTHHSLSLYRGIIDLYRVTGDTRLLEKAEDYLKWCRDCRIVTGGLPENMPTYYQDEGCALADYLVVNLMTFSVTGDDEFLEDAEHVLVNHFFMNQFHTGGFGHRLFAAEVIGGKGWQGWEGQFGSENPGCCSLWGQWAIGQVGRFIVTRPGEAVEVNLYPEADVELPDLGARLEIRSDFPAMSAAAITVRCDRPVRFPLRLRRPAWANSITVKLNGKDIDIIPSGSRLTLERTWKSGEAIEMTFGSDLRLVPWPAAGSDMAAVFKGPLCLGLSSAVADVDSYDGLLVDRQEHFVLSPDGEPQVIGKERQAISRLRPISEDWMSPDVMNPNRIRVLFHLTN
ncbi:MAG: metallophosphoesterase [Candidatus Aminicenantales bacterium]